MKFFENIWNLRGFLWFGIWEDKKCCLANLLKGSPQATQSFQLRYLAKTNNYWKKKSCNLPCLWHISLLGLFPETFDTGMEQVENLNFFHASRNVLAVLWCKPAKIEAVQCFFTHFVNILWHFMDIEGTERWRFDLYLYLYLYSVW